MDHIHRTHMSLCAAIHCAEEDETRKFQFKDVHMSWPGG